MGKVHLFLLLRKYDTKSPSLRENGGSVAVLSANTDCLSVVYKVFTQHYFPEVVLGEFFIFVFPLTISYGDRVG